MQVPTTNTFKQIPLVIALWEQNGYHGHKRLFVEDEPKLDLFGFNDQANAIGVHPGPDYQAWQDANGSSPYVILYEDEDYQGRGLMLGGGMANLDTLIQDYNFNGRASSLRISPPEFRDQVDINFLGVLGDPQRTPALDAPIDPPLVVELFVDAGFKGKNLVVVENSSNLATDFGSDFRDSISAVQVIAGSHYNGEKARLYPQDNFGGQPLELSPGSYFYVGNAFNDKARSITVR